MPDLTAPVAVAGSSTLTLADFLTTLHRRQLLRPMLVEAAIEKLLVDTARQAGLEISTEQLQQAVNRFRQQRGLRGADQASRWLTDQGLTLPDLENTLEADLLIAQLEEKLTAPKVADFFAAHREDFAQARLRILQVGSEGEARELLNQVNDEGRDFADLARQFSLHLPSRAAGGSLPPLCRCQLPAAVAEAVFKTKAGSVAGPLQVENGYALFLVEELLPAALNAAATALIRRRLFDAWLREKAAGIQVNLSWLD